MWVNLLAIQVVDSYPRPERHLRTDVHKVDNGVRMAAEAIAV